MLLQLNWSAAWTITLVGFLLVFCLLVLLVFVLLGFGAIMRSVSKPTSTASRSKATSTATLADATAEEAAAIALALHLAAEPAHDEESGKLTLKHNASSAWAPKSFGMNNL